eukprot:1801524-Pyramimonas_sp.AAC.1
MAATSSRSDLLCRSSANAMVSTICASAERVRRPRGPQTLTLGEHAEGASPSAGANYRRGTTVRDTTHPRRGTLEFPGAKPRVAHKGADSLDSSGAP